MLSDSELYCITDFTDFMDTLDNWIWDVVDYSIPLNNKNILLAFYDIDEDEALEACHNWISEEDLKDLDYYDYARTLLYYYRLNKLYDEFTTFENYINAYEIIKAN